MERVLGRSDDMLIVRGINVFPSQIETIVLAVDGAEPHYEIAVDRNEKHLDALEVRVEASPNVWKAGERRIELERQLNQRIRSALGITVTVRVVAPNEIPRSEGKAARVVDNRRL
jgi:phenylacetate-CoA ligase